MTDEDLSILDLKAFGYKELEARFLRLVALHSGVFLARQFNQFAQTKNGKRIDSFIKKLKSNRHCQTYRLAKNASIFHLTSKAIYRAIRHENLRHRRSHQIDYVKAKLLGLDFILQNPTLTYFPTEEEKIHLFTKILDVPLCNLPVKAYKTPHSKKETLRYFVDKYPLFTSDLSLPRPVVHFTYVDPGAYTSNADFLNHLRNYAQLFACMEAIRLIYIHQVSNKSEQAKELFDSFVQSGFKLKIDDNDLLKYFAVRQAWETKQYEKVGSKELLLLNHARKKYAGSQYEELYCDWKNGNHTLPVREKKVPAASFTAYKAGEPYALFGDLD